MLRNFQMLLIFYLVSLLCAFTIAVEMINVHAWSTDEYPTYNILSQYAMDVSNRHFYSGILKNDSICFCELWSRKINYSMILPKQVNDTDTLLFDITSGTIICGGDALALSYMADDSSGIIFLNASSGYIITTLTPFHLLFERPRDPMWATISLKDLPVAPLISFKVDGKEYLIYASTDPKDKYISIEGQGGLSSVICFDVTDFKLNSSIRVAWSISISEEITAELRVYEDKLFVVASDKLYVIDIYTGSIVSRLDLPGTSHYPIALAGNSILVVSDEGKLVSFNLNTFELNWILQLPGSPETPVIVRDDRNLYVICLCSGSDSCIVHIPVNGHQVQTIMKNLGGRVTGYALKDNLLTMSLVGENASQIVYVNLDSATLVYTVSIARFERVQAISDKYILTTDGIRSLESGQLLYSSAGAVYLNQGTLVRALHYGPPFEDLKNVEIIMYMQGEEINKPQNNVNPDQNTTPNADSNQSNEKTDQDAKIAGSINVIKYLPLITLAVAVMMAALLYKISRRGTRASTG